MPSQGWTELLAGLRRSPPEPGSTGLVMESLVAAGAPLWHWEPREHMSREELLPLALSLSHTDATVLRVLPLVLAKSWSGLNWRRVVQLAESVGELPALGMLVDLTGELTNDPSMAARAAELESARVPLLESFYFPAKNKYDAELAQARTPQVARKWGFLMNMTVDAFQGLLEKHYAPLHG